MTRASALAGIFLRSRILEQRRFDLTLRIKPLRYLIAKLYEVYINLAPERRPHSRETQLPRGGARAIVLLTPSNKEYKP